MGHLSVGSTTAFMVDQNAGTAGIMRNCLKSAAVLCYHAAWELIVTLSYNSEPVQVPGAQIIFMASTGLLGYTIVGYTMSSLVLFGKTITRQAPNPCR